MIISVLKRSSFAGVIAFFLVALAAPTGTIYAQEQGESKYEKIQKEKIKRNRKRIKRTERAYSNQKQLRRLRYQTGNRQGDRPYQENRSTRAGRRRISPSSTPAVYAQPDPYSFRSRRDRKRNVYSNDAQKLTPRPPAKAWDNGRGRNSRISNRTQPRINIYPQPDPYSFRKRRSERSRISGNQNSFGTSPRSPERAARKAPAKYNNQPAGRINLHPQVSPYSFRKRRSERDRISRSQTTFGTSPRDPESVAGRAPSRYNNRPAGRINIFPQSNPYSFRRMRSEGDRISNNQTSYATSPRDTERPPKRKRIKINTASGRYFVSRRAKPYKLRDRKKWEETYTGGFYGRKQNINPRNTQRTSGIGAPDPYSRRGRLGDKPYSGAVAGGFEAAPRSTQRAWKGDIAGRKLRTTSSERRRLNVFPGIDPYGRRAKRSERDRISRNQDFYGSTPRTTQRASGKKRIQPRTMTSGYIVRRKAKPYNIRDVKKWEETYTGGFYGRKEGIGPRATQRVSSMASPDTYRGRGRLGDKPYQGMAGGFSTEPKPHPRAWKGDIAGRNLRRSIPRDTQRDGGRALNTIAGSVSGRMLRDNEGKAIRSYIPGNIALKAPVHRGDRNMFEVYPGFDDDYLNYQGDFKTRRADKGGGSLARNEWNNKGDRLPQKFQDRSSRVAGSFSGSVKASRPLKGGGSASGGIWNNDGQSMPKKYSAKEHLVAGNFSGSLKASKPLKGGGSLARGDWNNDGRSIPRKFGDKDSRLVGGFGGTIKASRPEKGGGSVSRGDAWNNNGSALARKYTGNSWSKHEGKIKKKSGYTRNKNADDNALKVREPDKSYFAAGNFTGNLKKSNRKINGPVHSETKFHNAKNVSNAVEEKEKLISFKIFWNRLFGKDVPEPERERKPRYDRGEKGLWNE